MPADGRPVPPIVAGLVEANYVEFWEAVRAWLEPPEPDTPTVVEAP